MAGSDSDFEVDLGESLHLQSDARLAVYKIRLADSFLSTAHGGTTSRLRRLSSQESSSAPCACWRGSPPMTG